MSVQYAIYFDDAPVLFQDVPEGDGEGFLTPHMAKAIEISGNASERYRIGPYEGPFPLSGEVLEHSLSKFTESRIEEAIRTLDCA